MSTGRTAFAGGLLAVEAGVAVLGVFVHHGFTAEYGDITDSALEGLGSGFSTGVGAVALVPVGVAALVAALVARRPSMRLVAVAIPVLMVVGMLAVTPLALRQKLQVQYDPTPQCGGGEDMAAGPGLEAVRESQQAFDSIEHVGYFGGAGATGEGGCDRPLVLTQDLDVLQHYRAALSRGGWRVVEDDAQHLRAERAGRALEVVTCAGGGVVWAGKVGDTPGARCEQP